MKTQLLVACLGAFVVACTAAPVRDVADPAKTAGVPPVVEQPSGVEQRPRTRLIAGSNRVARKRINEVYPAIVPRRQGPIESMRRGPDRATGEITLDFKGADVREVVAAILGELLRLNYTIDPNVSGSVTVTTSRPVAKSALIPILDSVLAAQGLVLAGNETLYRVARVDTVSAIASGGIDLAGGDLEGGVRVYPLAYLGAAEFQKILEPLLPAKTILRPDTARNFLVVAGSIATHGLVDEAIGIFDIDQMADQNVSLISLESAEAAEVVEELDRIFGVAGLKASQVPLIQFLPIKRLNAVMVITRQSAYLNRARQWVLRLDRIQDPDEPRLYVYYLQNGSAQKMAETLNGVSGTLDGRDVPNKVRASIAGTPLATTPATPLAAGPTAVSSRRVAPSGTSITVDEERNALLISTSPKKFVRIEKVLATLDIEPLQVLIEASIFEVDLVDELRFGIQYAISGGGLGLSNNSLTTLTGGTASTTNASGLVTPTIAPLLPGFSFALNGASASRLILDTLSDLTEVKMISSPNVIVQNNKTARLKVGDEVPIVTQTSASTVSDNPQIVNNVQYRSTGVNLEVRPRVNASGLVTLQIDQEVSDVRVTTSSSIDSPTITTRSLLTTATIRSGDTVFLGGLIRRDAGEGKRGIPLLHDLPLIGALFGQTVKTARRVELVVLLRPVIIASPEDAQIATSNMRQKFLALLAREGTALRQPRRIIGNDDQTGGT